MQCPSCRTENREGAKFCVNCGRGLALACPACGSSYQQGDLFCAECGHALQAVPVAPEPAREAPTSERRFVSVLFADLVGFTSASESRDAEETLAESAYPLLLIGRWQEASARLAEAEEARALGTGFEDTADVQDRTGYAAQKAMVRQAQGRYGEALAAAEEALEAVEMLSWASQSAKTGVVVGVEAALALGDLERAEQLVALVEAQPAGAVPLYLRAQAARLRARLSAARGEEDKVEPRLKSAAATFRELGLPFWTAVAELELGQWLASQGQTVEATPLLARARETFARLEAAPWLERADAAGAAHEPDVVAAGS